MADAPRRLPTLVKDVSAADFIKACADHLKLDDKFELPGWIDHMKTAAWKELSPLDDDWYYVRAAAIARRIYVRQGAGVGALQKYFGGKARNGVHRNHNKKASAGVIRHAVQQLAKIGWLEDCESGGRQLTRVGRQQMDQIASAARAATVS